MKLKKCLCRVLTVRDMCYMMGFVYWLIFIKIVLHAVKRLKKVSMIAKDCDN